MALGKKAGIVVVAVLLLGITAYGLLVVDKPRIQSVENEWGTVESDRTEVETRIVVDNPFLLRVTDGVANVQYAVVLNGITFATESKNQVRLGGSEDVITVSTWIDNDDIPRWWVTHVNGNETTTVTVDPEVAIEYVGTEFPADEYTRTRTFHTDFLDPLDTERNREFSAFGRTVLVVNETDARWGHATLERTPIHASITVTNRLPLPLPITELEYTIRMNGIVVGHGTAGRQTVIPPGQTRTLDARAHLDSSDLDEWWVTHIRRNETTRLTVDFNATIEYRGIERRFPLEFVSYNRTFRTHVFTLRESGNRSSHAVASSEEIGGRRGARTGRLGSPE